MDVIQVLRYYSVDLSFCGLILANHFPAYLAIRFGPVKVWSINPFLSLYSPVEALANN